MTDSLPKFMVGSGCSLLDQGLELLEGPEGMGLAANPLHQADTACPALKCMKVQDNIVLPSIRPPDHSWPLLP
ncbi:hypothetical protein XMM379_003120 [Aliiroseovarius sp. xm-m-379]|nr:hypothetical protein [Aliiroseovarius sp. xm-m-379]NRP35203.1 hypothetical protein [Aliiroseovarius sp. xm-a-104]NRQ22325.1 hypothetical protein [Aliiroseovarius sp. xm-v-204]NRQ27619.1 hypothetical protein [Aliiroseovarius sp. xm-g-7]